MGEYGGEGRTYDVESDVGQTAELLDNVGNATLVGVSSTSAFGDTEVGDDVAQRVRFNENSKLEVLVGPAVGFDNASDAVDELAIEDFSVFGYGKFTSGGRGGTVAIGEVVDDEGKDVLLMFELFFLPPRGLADAELKTGDVSDTVNP